MMKHLVFIVAAALGLGTITLATSADAQVTAFGFTLGETTTQEALKQGTGKGTNAYSDGPMVAIPVHQFDVTGLEEMLLIFDKNDRLSAISIGMANNKFASVHGHLSETYSVREQNIPFVGNRLVRYGAPDTTIILDAPHMSFSMTLLYARDHFYAEFKRRQRLEQQQKQGQERSHF